MKYSFFIFFFAAIAFASCTKERDEMAHVRFLNATGKALTDISVDNLPIGDMAPGETTEYYEFDGFGTDSGWPDVQFAATIDKARVKNLPELMWCGTEKSQLQSGKHTVRVSMHTVNNQQFVSLRFE